MSATTGPQRLLRPRLAAPTTARQALRVGLLLLAGSLTVTVIGGLFTKAVMPGASGTTRALAVLVVLTGVAVAARPWFGSWSALGINGLRSWARPRALLILLLPLVLAVSPLAFGVQALPATTWLLLLGGYALTGFTEELVWRGIALRVLAPLGPARGPLIGSALFGLAHLSNVLYRDSVALVAAQAWGAFCFGVGYAALRRRTNTIVPLMGLHLLTDLCAAVTTGPSIALLVGQDIALLTLGVLVLGRDSRTARGHSNDSPLIGPVGGPARRPAPDGHHHHARQAGPARP